MNKPATAADALQPTAEAAWVLTADGFDPLREHGVESRFAVSNGLFGVRAARGMTRGNPGGVPAATYVAGLFDTPGDSPGAPILFPVADWLQVRILLPTEPLVRHPSDVATHRMTLDMKRGALLSAFQGSRPPSPAGQALEISARTLRLVSLADRSLGLQLVELAFAIGDTDVTLEASCDGLDLGFFTERVEQDLGLWGVHSGRQAALAVSASLSVDEQDLSPASRGVLKTSWTWRCRPGQVARLARLVALVRTDAPADDAGRRASAKLADACRTGWRRVVADHEAAWSARWRVGDVKVEGDDKAQEALRFAVYHLSSAANPDDDRVSIGARALTGDDYHGHVFWDTEIYLLPFYTMTWPEAARALLMYRHRTLDGARLKAAAMGCRGALYAWESADTGEETTPLHAIGPDSMVVDILCGKQEQHISADVAYAVWQYWQATGDDVFLLDAGAEILFETARFWSSRAQLESDGCRHIRGVIGPDEYHETIDDNAFTNVMARWNMRRALDVASLLRESWPEQWKSISSKLDLDEAELSGWSLVADTIATGLDPKTGMFEQFEGFEHLERIDLRSYDGRLVPMDLVLGRARLRRSQVIKQADVVALLALLPGEFPGAAGLRNFEYYEPRCSHGSSLSRAMHGLAAARLGLTAMALRFFHETAAIDLSDTHVAIDGGIHIAALGGTWLTAVCGFAGLSMTADGPAVDPRLPAAWQSLSFSVQWHGRSLHIRIDQLERRIEVRLDAGYPITMRVSGQPHRILGGQMLQVDIGTPNGRAPGSRVAQQT
jgi:trehalose/maltose hydrolase-like predicted phosphorylase